MARTANPKAGEMPCENCGRAVFVRRTPSGKLNYVCDGCDRSAYAEQGGDCMRAWSARMTAVKADEPAPAEPAAQVKEQAEPAARRPASVFSLGAL